MKNGCTEGESKGGGKDDKGIDGRTGGQLVKECTEFRRGSRKRVGIHNFISKAEKWKDGGQEGRWKDGEVKWKAVRRLKD